MQPAPYGGDSYGAAAPSSGYPTPPGGEIIVFPPHVLHPLQFAPAVQISDDQNAGKDDADDKDSDDDKKDEDKDSDDKDDDKDADDDDDDEDKEPEYKEITGEVGEIVEF